MENKNNQPNEIPSYKNKLEYKDVTAFYKVQYKDPQTKEEFEELEELLDNVKNPQYYSKTAETRRILQKQRIFKLKYFKAQKYIELFESLCTSYLYTINKNLDYEKVKLLDFYFEKNNKRLYRIDIFDKEYFRTLKRNEDDKISVPFSFTIKFITQDIIYKNEYKITFPTKTIFENSKKNYFQNFKTAKIKILSSMKTPFPLEHYSIKTIMVRKDFRSNFKKYTNEIEKGIHKELYKK